MNPSWTAPARIAAWSSLKNPERTGTERTSAITMGAPEQRVGATAVETSAFVAGAATGRGPHRRDLVGGRHVEAMAHEQQRSVVLFPIVARHAVDGDHDIKVIEERVPCRRLDASLGGAPSDHDGLDPIAAQQHLEVGAPERARSVFAHHQLITTGCKRLDKVVARCAVDGVTQRSTATAFPGMHAEVEADLSR